MTTLLIAGSRYHVTKPMAEATRLAVRRALANDWQIIAGDACGIDETVAETVRRESGTLDTFRLAVYGIHDTPRHGILCDAIYYVNVSQLARFKDNAVTRHSLATQPTWTQRDQYMVSVAHKIMCIWNGESNGTRSVVEYALANGFRFNTDIWVYNKEGKLMSDWGIK